MAGGEESVAPQNLNQRGSRQLAYQSAAALAGGWRMAAAAGETAMRDWRPGGSAASLRNLAAAA